MHHYAGLPMPSVLLAGALEVPTDQDVELAELVSADLLPLLIEGTTRVLANPAHDLIAQEALTQLLTPGGPVGVRAGSATGRSR